MSMWTDAPANDSVRLARIYRILNEGLVVPTEAKKGLEAWARREP